jgi:hypothetical protein
VAVRNIRRTPSQVFPCTATPDGEEFLVSCRYGLKTAAAVAVAAAMATVTAAGGTELARARGARGWAERVWHTRNGASGSGCSTFIPKPAWQHDSLCLARTDVDVSAVAANLAVYDSSLGTTGPWLLVGGTSAASPLIAGVYALAGNAATVPPGYPYAHTSGLFDVTKGNNDWLDRTRGAACDYTYLCMATKGYDGPTGLGTPDGTSAF